MMKTLKKLLMIMYLMGSVMYGVQGGDEHKQDWWRVPADAVTCMVPCILCYACCVSSVDVDHALEMRLLQRDGSQVDKDRLSNIKNNQGLFKASEKKDKMV